MGFIQDLFGTVQNVTELVAPEPIDLINEVVDVTPITEVVGNYIELPIDNQ